MSGSETAYHELVARTWAEGHGFTIVEQDIAPYPGALGAMWACPEPWCVTPYRCNGQYEGYLGCVRFSDALVQSQPDAIEAIDRLKYDGTPRRYWGRLDTRLQQVLESRGYAKHRHWPSVTHLHQYDLEAIWHCTCGAEIPEAMVAAGPPPYHCLNCPR